MSDKTLIRWANSTWNPTRGCSVVSPGCTNCYAMKKAARFSGPGLPYEGLAKMVNGHAVWTGDIRLLHKQLDLPLKWRKPRRIFVDSMSDLFHEKVPWEFIDRVYAVMEQATHHQYLILTKRPQVMQAYMRERYADRPVPRNVWLGTSVEDQVRANERIPLLLDTPAVIRFLSCEPLVGQVDLSPWLHHPDWGWSIPRLHWVIAGGESGPARRRREMKPEWARLLRDQCVNAGVAFFFKQESAFLTESKPYLDGLKWEQYPDKPLLEQPPQVYGSCEREQLDLADMGLTPIGEAVAV